MQTDTNPHGWLRPTVAVCLLTALATLSLGTFSVPGAQASSSQLTGLFRISSGYCGSSTINGSYFRMILANGGANGPYLSNSNSGCSDQTFTPLTAGTDGGLRTGMYQSPPSTPFDSSGNARSGTITGPVKFYGTNFATGTNAKDPQTGIGVSAPVIYDNNGALSGDLRAFAVTWNNQYFNQGSPKPNGSYPGNTRGLTGSYDASTGRFAIDWTSQIVGGPFNNFTGKWHLEGVFVPSSKSTANTEGTTAVVGGTSSSHTVTTPGAAATQKAGVATSTPSASAASTAGSDGPTVAAADNTATAAVTSTNTKRVWSVSWPVLGLAIGLGILGVGAIVVTGRASRKTPGA